MTEFDNEKLTKLIKAIGNQNRSTLAGFKLLYYKIEVLESILKEQSPELNEVYQQKLYHLLKKNRKDFPPFDDKFLID